MSMLSFLYSPDRAFPSSLILYQTTFPCVIAFVGSTDQKISNAIPLVSMKRSPGEFVRTIVPAHGDLPEKRSKISSARDTLLLKTESAFAHDKGSRISMEGISSACSGELGRWLSAINLC
jgi:hypothetical protein